MRACRLCGGAIPDSRPAQARYCGDECYQAEKRLRSQNKRPLRAAGKCKVCGGEIVGRHPCAVTCSDPCRDERKRQQAREKWERQKAGTAESMEPKDPPTAVPCGEHGYMLNGAIILKPSHPVFRGRPTLRDFKGFTTTPGQSSITGE